MTVVPNRPVDGNRRPKVRNTGAQHGTAGRRPAAQREVPSELPPVLFTLPNLRPGSQTPALGAEHVVPAESSLQDVAENLSIRIDSSESARSDAERSSPPPHQVAPVAVERRSLISRLMTNAMLLGVIGLGATWVYVVAKNVRSSGTAQVDETNGSENLAVKDVPMSSDSTASMEDMVANAERLAFNQNGNLPSAATAVSVSPEPTTKAELPRSTDLMAEATAAAQEVQGSLETRGAAISELTSQSTTNSDLNQDAKPDGQELAGTSIEPGDFNVMMPAAVVTDQTTAIAASTRSASNEDSANELSMVPPVQSFKIDPLSANDTPLLPAASVVPNAAQPVQTATPSGLTPPLADDMDAVLAEIKADSSAEKKTSEKPRRFSKSPAAVTDWLQYLPPTPKQ